MKKLLLTVLSTVMLPIALWAQMHINGQVKDAQGKTLSGATIQLNANQQTITDAQGAYEFTNLKAGNYSIKASYIGYGISTQQVRLKESSQQINFTLYQSLYIADEIVVTNTRATEKSATTHKNFSKADIEQNNFGQDLPFIIQNTPGVIVTSDAGSGIGYTGIRIRGSDATRVNVTVNGIPYNDSESQGTFWVNMPDFASSVESIQIQRGVGTSTNGAGAFGGSLNIQTQNSATESYVELNNSAGSFNSWKNTVKIGTGLLNNKFSFDGRFSRISSDGYIDRASSELKSFYLSGSYHGKNDVFKVNVFGGTEKTYQAWNGAPEARFRNDMQGMQDYIVRNELSAAEAENLLNSGQRYNSFTYKDQTDNYNQNHYQAFYAKQVNDKLSFNLALHYTRGLGYYEEFKNNAKLANYGFNPVTIGGTSITRTDLVRRRWLDNHFYGTTYGLNYRMNPVLSLSLGGGYNEYTGDHYGQVIWAQYASNSLNDKHYYDNTGKKKDFNTFLRANIQANEQLAFFADMQYRNIDYKVLGTDKNINNLDIQDQLNFFNPKVGFTYDLSQSNHLYASYSIANKEPSRDDYINVDLKNPLKSERLNDIEIGYRYKDTKFQIGVNAYGMYYKDQLVVTGKINDVGEYYRQNVAKSHRMGIELDAAYQLNAQWLFQANAAISENKIKAFTEYLDDYDLGGQQTFHHQNTDISFSPKQVLFAEAVFKPISKLAFALQGKYVGKQYLDNTQHQDRKLDAYFISNFRMAYDFSVFNLKNINIALLVNNLFDKKYANNGYTYGYFMGSRITENFYFPQAGSNFLLNLNVKF